jgi:hypothetical protein
VSAKIKDTDKGYKKLMKELAKKKSVTVGVHDAEGSKDHGGVTVLDVATWNEFGTDKIPARSFIGAWFDENREVGKSKLLELLQKDSKKAYELFGLWAVGQIQQRIANSIPPPNAPSTVKAKGSSVPLINTGQLRQNVTFRVKEGE